MHTLIIILGLGGLVFTSLAHAYDEYNDYGFQSRDEYIEYERTMDFIEQYDREVYQRGQDERLEGIEKQLKKLNECNRWPGRCR